ncbi:8-amino-7-oxononanoate synthase [Prauserella halophila]|uniref:8-amino-7-oxononanoate synthase n=1 Tax=Prauserella halophila TaxID=185641 RepID=A0ABN1WAX9_9PSEU|nr:aminotransferase class I/II-fold pyridoxal phosphate-dependent enzyme [Prauserella halophila]MCP2234941.1 8-amino-7-oxononanoate synthase [Prauserella halophila]
MNAPGPALPPDEVFDWLDADAATRTEAGLTHRPRPRGSAPAPGEIDLTGDDYLGLARDKRVAGATAAASLKWGAGAAGTRLLGGSLELHAELEHELARFLGAPAAAVFPSAYTANLAAVTALSGAESAIVSDKYVNPALVDGCRLARGDVAAVAHLDPDAVAHALSTRRKSRALVVSESVFAVDGDAAELGGLVDTCRSHGAALLVDDAHGFGVLGDGGRGAVHDAGLSSAPDVVTTLTLAGALGVQGGAVLGPRRAIRQITDVARTYGHDAAPAPGTASAALAALTALREEPDLPGTAVERAMSLATGLRTAGLRTSLPAAAIVSLPAPSAPAAASWVDACAEHGVHVSRVTPPVAPDGVTRLRLTARAGLSESDVDTAVKVIAETAPRS